MARAIERLIEDPALRLRLGEFAREEAVSKHSWEHYLDRLDKLFALISKGRSVNLM
jgi:glycosyltransferase involved in cell wall biosynthesis